MEELYNVLKITFNDRDESKPIIPLFSFEGLPGAGKTTQIKRVTDALEQKYGKGYYIDLPTKSQIGKILKLLYSDEVKWNEIRKLNPWLNPILISTDLRIAMDIAIKNGAKYAIMSRGILSTYYYNLDAYGEQDWKEQWLKMQKHMKAFYKPSVIIFMDIEEDEAHNRVVKRNRGPLREMDQIEKMKKDKKMFERYLSMLSDIPVHHVNASDTEQIVTNNIVKELERYL